MRKTSWLAITLAASAVAPITVTTLTIVQPAWAQVVRSDDVISAMNRARRELQPIRQRIERADRAGRAEDRTAAVAEMKRVLDELAPAVESMTGDVETQRAVHGEFDRWMAEYNAAATANASETGDFFLMMSERWSQLSTQTQGMTEETRPATFKDLVADSSISGFGMPKTLAAAQALSAYLTEIQAHRDYAKNKSQANVAADLANARKAHSEATQKLADAATAVLADASAQKLDQTGRDRVWTMLQTDLPQALAGSPRLEDVQASARSLVNGFDNEQQGDASSIEARTKRVTELGDSLWPSIAARYAATKSDPLHATRGELIHLRDAKIAPADIYRGGDADMVLLVNGRPVVCVFDPVVKQHVQNMLKETQTKTLPENGIEVIGIVRGLGSIDAIQQPGTSVATTNPSGSEGESSPRTTPVLAATDSVVLDVLAIHAGAASIGVDPTPAQLEAAP